MTSFEEQALKRALESGEQKATKERVRALAWTLDDGSEDLERIFGILKDLKRQRMPANGHVPLCPTFKTTELLELVFHPRVHDPGKLRVMVRVGSTIRRIKANEFELILTDGLRCTFRFTGGVMTLLQRPSRGSGRAQRHSGRGSGSLTAVRMVR